MLALALQEQIRDDIDSMGTLSYRRRKCCLDLALDTAFEHDCF